MVGGMIHRVTSMMTVRDLGLNHCLRAPDLPNPLDQDSAVWRVFPPGSEPGQGTRCVDGGGILGDLSRAIGPPTGMCLLGDNLIGVTGWAGVPLARQYQAVTEGAGAFVASSMLYLRVAGPDAAALLDMLTPRDVPRLQTGKAMFAIFTTREGTVDEEAIILRTGPDEYLVSCGGGKWMSGLSEALEAWPRAIVEESDIVSFNIKGPRQAAAMQALLQGGDGPGPAALRPFGACRARTAGGEQVWVLKTRVGMEMWGHASTIRRAWRKILQEPAVATPCAWDVLNVFRLECTSMVFAVYPLDIHVGTTLWEGGYGWMVEKEERDFIGRDALRASRGRERYWLAGLAANDDAAEAPPVGAAVTTRDGELAGFVTTSAYSVRHRRALAFAHLRRGCRPGDTLALEGYQEWTVNPLPFDRVWPGVRMQNQA